MASTSDSAAATDLSLWKCPLCLDSYRNPKLLPCSHTFCRQCLDDLIRHSRGRSGSTFNCPSCREVVKLPSGGVDSFKNNYYLDAARPKEMLCSVHTDRQRELELFCRQCKACICLKCKLEDHAYHTTEEVKVTAESVKTKMAKDVDGLTSTMTGLKGQAKTLSAEQKAVKDKQAAVERDIEERHRQMVKVADSCRNDALFSLDTATASITSQLDVDMRQLTKTLDSLDKLKKRMDLCLQEEAGSRMLEAARGIYQDSTRHEKEVQRLLTTRIAVVSRPVLRQEASADVTLAMQRKFMGCVEMMDMQVSEVDVSVKQMFTCPSVSGKSREVYSLFPRTDDKVWVAYEVGGDGDGRCPELLSVSGQVTETETSVKGRTSFAHNNQGTGICIVQTSGSCQTYAKSRSLMKLKSYPDATSVVMEVSIKSESPLRISSVRWFSIRCGLHRAFDVDENKRLCAVVEEAQAPQGQRHVHVYDGSQETPLGTYRPPMAYQPADVCFHKLAGCHVLLVADEQNDVIHVVRLDRGQLDFACYLAAGNPLIIQPTALNTDVQGRVWVGCRSGAVLLCEPSSW